MTSSNDSLPQLSTWGWLSVLLAGLAILILGVYPLVVYPTVARRDSSSALAVIMRSPVLAIVFAAASIVLLVMALRGERPARTRDRWAHAAFVVALVGVGALLGGIYGAGV